MQADLSNKDRPEIIRLRRLLIFALVCVIPLGILFLGRILILLEILPEYSHLFPRANFFGEGIYLNLIISFIFSTLLVFGPGLMFIFRAVRSIRQGRINMDVLISVGFLSAWGLSTLATFYPELFGNLDLSNTDFYDIAGFIIFFIMYGIYLDVISRGKANYAIGALLHLRVKEARIFKNGSVVYLPVEQVGVGDILVIRAGERIPLDGTIIVGSTTIDESMLTGESMPVYKKVGDYVIGSTLSKTGNIQVRVTKVGSTTILAQILTLVQEAQKNQEKIIGFRDNLASKLVPGIFGAAIILLSFWLVFGSAYTGLPLYVFLSVLMISTPVTLGFASPFLKNTASEHAAVKGVIVKDSMFFELGHKINIMVFGKTGTLTRGHQQVHSFKLIETKIFKISQEDILNYAYSLERFVDHPVSNAILKYVQTSHPNLSKEIIVKDFEAVEHRGLTGKIDEYEVLLGSLAFLQEKNVYISRKVHDAENEISVTGSILIGMAVNKEVVALFSILDLAKEDVKAVIERIRSQKIELKMLTADSIGNAEQVGEKVGIMDIEADLAPSEKLSRIKALQGHWYDRKIVCMVGDGVNDAPALAQADIGIAMGTGTDVAIESADIVLKDGDLSKLLYAMDLSRKVFNRIQVNSYFVFGLNLLLLPLAGGLLFPGFGWLLQGQYLGFVTLLSLAVILSNNLLFQYFE